MRALRAALADDDLGAADPAALTRLTARAVRHGRTMRFRRRAGVAALPIGVAAAVGATVLAPGGGAGGPVVGPAPSSTAAETPPAGLGGGGSATDLFLAASVRRLSSPAGDGPVFWCREIYQAHVVPAPGGQAQENRAEQYWARSDDGKLRVVLTTDGKTKTHDLTGLDAKYALTGLYKAGYERNGPEGMADFVRLYTKAEIRALPADPGKLAAIMDDGLASDVPEAARGANRLGVVVSLMQTPATPEVQAAAFKVLAQTPGITVVGAATDPLGRVGTAFDATLPPDMGATTARLILADDGKVLSLRTDDVAGGSWQWTAYVDCGYRDDLGP
ncbi:hypothetical protein BCD49_27890 [Pseudofrankia sp. EUN1h]|nr:hypothetical protein BCD49_27890 [Pseudofrankia sp. EUN1h]